MIQEEKRAKIAAIFEGFNRLNILIVGDVMVDTYLYGKVERISPEAPVPIVAINRKENRMGGAANVALNVQALGANPILCSVIGQDANAEVLSGLLNDFNMSAEGIISSGHSVTTVKTRVIGNNHQMLRIDEEIESDLKAVDQDRLFKVITSIFDTKKIDALIFEDYDKGTLCESTITQLIAEAAKRGIPVAADPKKKNFRFYKNIQLFKPNLKELREGLKLEIDASDIDSLNIAVDLLQQEQHLETALITLSELGVYVSANGKQLMLPAHIRNIADVSGAGDTVIAVATLALAMGLEPELIANLANLAGGLVCESLGAVPIDKQQLFEEARHIKNLYSLHS
jgi:rfaE bifunctional protein kinase chain/domain